MPISGKPIVVTQQRIGWVMLLFVMLLCGVGAGMFLLFVQRSSTNVPATLYWMMGVAITVIAATAGLAAYRTLRPKVLFEVTAEGIYPHYGASLFVGPNRGPQGQRAGRAELLPWADIETIALVERKLPLRSDSELIDVVELRLHSGVPLPHQGSALMWLAELPGVAFLASGGEPGRQALVQIMHQHLETWRRQTGPIER